jgi:hypothetical protein
MGFGLRITAFLFEIPGGFKDRTFGSKWKSFAVVSYGFFGVVGISCSPTHIENTD